MLLAGDIGGTKTVLAVFSPEAGLRRPLKEETFASARFPSLEDIVLPFIEKAGVPAGSSIDRAVFGVAGPVVQGRSRITNLPWILEEKKLRKVLRIPSLRLLNDLVALAHAVPILEPADLRTLNRGTPDPGGTIAVIAPGTGLGEAYLVLEKWGAGTRYRPHASEGGHADFAPLDSLEVELLGYLHKRFSHVSYERVCSGPGLYEIYSFLKASERGEEPSWLADQFATADDPARVIVQAAVGKDSPSDLCVKTLHLFASILGAEAGNLALKVLATKGVYLSGGVPPAILPILEKGPFLRAFQGKGRMCDLLSSIPVHVLINPRAALMGAGHFGLTECE